MTACCRIAFRIIIAITIMSSNLIARVTMSVAFTLVIIYNLTTFQQALDG